MINLYKRYVIEDDLNFNHNIDPKGTFFILGIEEMGR